MTIDCSAFHWSLFDHGEGPWIWHPRMGDALVRFFWMRAKSRRSRT